MLSDLWHAVSLTNETRAQRRDTISVVYLSTVDCCLRLLPPSIIPFKTMMIWLKVRKARSCRFSFSSHSQISR